MLCGINAVWVFDSSRKQILSIFLSPFSLNFCGARTIIRTVHLVDLVDNFNHAKIPVNWIPMDAWLLAWSKSQQDIQHERFRLLERGNWWEIGERKTLEELVPSQTSFVANPQIIETPLHEAGRLMLTKQKKKQAGGCLYHLCEHEPFQRVILLNNGPYSI